MQVTFPYKIIFALLSALLFSLAFPTSDIWFLAWVALVPLFFAIRETCLPATAGLGLIAGLGIFAGVCSWFLDVAGMRWVDFTLLGTSFAVNVAACCVILEFIRRNTRLPFVLVAPVVWVGFEYIRMHEGFLVLPDVLLGYTLYNQLALIQVASITGVYGISFLIVMINAAIYQLILQNKVKPLVASILIVLVSTAYGFIVLSGEHNNESIKISVIQANIPQEIKWDKDEMAGHLSRHIAMSRMVAHDKPRLIVWPEASVQTQLVTDLVVKKRLFELAKETGAFLLVGSSQQPKIGDKGRLDSLKWMNSAHLISPNNKIVGTYTKVRLVPFSEYLPMAGIIPWPQRYRDHSMNFVAGEEYTVFGFDKYRISAPICWETLFPDLIRNFILQGANLIINLGNEAQFGSKGAYQSMSMNVFRAVENRVPVVRAFNSGISGFIDPYGRVIKTVGKDNKKTFVEGVATVDLPLSQSRTLYTGFGDIFAILNIFVLLLLLGFSVAVVTGIPGVRRSE